MFSLNGDQWQVCKVGVHDEKKAFKIGDIRKKKFVPSGCAFTD